MWGGTKLRTVFGKNEMWYAVVCEPGAYLYCGLSRYASKEEIRERIENKTITEILYVKSSSNVYDEALNEAAATIEEDSSEGQLLVSCEYFECYKYDISDSVSINVDTASFRAVIFTEECGTIRVCEDVKAYKAGDSFYITAGNKTVEIEGNGGVIVTKV